VIAKRGLYCVVRAFLGVKVLGRGVNASTPPERGRAVGKLQKRNRVNAALEATDIIILSFVRSFVQSEERHHLLPSSVINREERYG